jgi:sugar lactone lactonase YvrE
MLAMLTMKMNACLIGACLLAAASTAAEFRISSINANGNLTWTNAFPAGVVTVESKGSLSAPWLPGTNYFTSNSVGSARIVRTPTNGFVRLLAVDISTNTPRHYTNLLESYGILETVAGRGQYNGDHINYWSNSLAGGFGTNMNLSRPHIAFGDALGNVLIVDQGSSAIEKVTPDGRIYTYAGTHVAGNNGDGPAPATNLQLRFPNGGWLRADGVFYVLDTENGKVRRIDTNGIMSTIFSTADPNYMGDGRAFWVKSDESLIYFGSGPGVDLNATTLNKWTPTGGVSVVRAGFGDLGNILGDERTGDLYISDRNANRVYRMDTNENLIPIAGNGTQTGGGEGFPALETGLILPRSIWFIPNGGFFIGEHDPGNRIWYVDPAGIIHRWMNGSSSANTFGIGDGQWFYANPSLAKVSRVRCVNADPLGNLIITESNSGYVRRIRFKRMNP